MTDLRDGIGRVEGVRLRLRLVEPEDAGYIHGLRTNPAYNAHLSTVEGTVDDQRRWIEAYKAREAAGGEYYYVIERLSDGVRCGVVRLYGITGETFTWGSWILDSGKPPMAALESALLSFGVAFDRLDLHCGLVDVRRENTHAIAFYERFGMQPTGEDALNRYFLYTRGLFEADRAGYLAALGDNSRVKG